MEMGDERQDHPKDKQIRATMPLILRTRGGGPKRKANTPKRREKPRPQWNSYLTDDDRFKLPKEKVLERKSLFVSKHNIMHSVDISPVKQAKRRVRQQTKVKATPKHAVDLLDNQSVSSDSDDEDSILQPNENSNVNVKETPSTPHALPVKHTHDFRVTHVNTTSKLATEKTTTPSVTPTPRRPRATMPHRVMKSAPSSLPAAEANELRDMIMNLQQELHYYKQLSVQELDVFISDDELSVGSLMKYLTTLVCQTMTHLLQSELALQEQKSNYDTLSQRLDELTNKFSTVTINKIDNLNKIDNSSYSTPASQPLAVSSPSAERTHDLYHNRREERAEESHHLSETLPETTTPVSHKTFLPQSGAGTSTSDWLLSASSADMSPPITVTKRLYDTPQQSFTSPTKSGVSTPANQRIAALQRQIALLRHQKYDAEHGSGEILRQMMRSSASPVSSEHEQSTTHRVYLDASQADREVWFDESQPIKSTEQEQDEDRMNYDALSSTLFSTPVPSSTRAASPPVYIPSALRTSGEYEASTIYMPSLPAPQLAPMHPYGSGIAFSSPAK